MKYKKTSLYMFILMVVSTQINADIYKEAFCFLDTIVKEKKLVESNLITIHGLEKDEKLKIGGMGGYMLNGAYMGRESTVVKNGDKIRLLHEAIDEDGARASTVLMVGNRYDIFTSVTNKGGLPESSYHIDDNCQ